MASNDIWGEILEGAPKLPITVGNTTITTSDENKGWALVTVQKDDKQYYGAMILRDGSNIPAGIIAEDHLGGEDFNDYDDNVLTMDEFNQLISVGCLFISCSGYYSQTFKWMCLPDGWDEYHGLYWSSTYDEGNDGFYNFSIDIDDGVSAGGRNYDNNDYMPVRLVKKMVP